VRRLVPGKVKLRGREAGVGKEQVLSSPLGGAKEKSTGREKGRKHNRGKSSKKGPFFCELMKVREET